MAGNFDGIMTRRFGIEIEMTGLARCEAAKTLAKAFGSEPQHSGGTYDKYYVPDSKGRDWTIMSDGSLTCTTHDGRSASRFYSVEMVTPILEYSDLDMLHSAVKALRKAGAICNDSTGIHIHCDCSDFSPQQIRNLVNLFASKEDMLYQALQVADWREDHYCQKVDQRFLRQLNQKKPKTMEQIKHLWFDDTEMYHGHYNSARYHCLNLSPVFTDDNFEVRAFNSVLHFGVLRSYLSLVLAVANQAVTQKYASPAVTHSSNPRYTFRTWLIRIGLNGEEFKNCRMHLLKHLSGNIAWRHPEDAIAQRERLKAEREAARNERVSAVTQDEGEGEETPDEEQNGAVGDLSGSLDDEAESEEMAENTAVTMNM